MFIGYFSVDMHIPHSRSLKDKRRVINSIKQRARNSFNVAVAEAPSDKWQRARLGFACIGCDKLRLSDTLDRLEEHVRLYPDILILDSQKQVL